jgi:hypothetical protein
MNHHQQHLLRVSSKSPSSSRWCTRHGDGLAHGPMHGPSMVERLERSLSGRRAFSVFLTTDKFGCSQSARASSRHGPARAGDRAGESGGSSPAQFGAGVPKTTGTKSLIAEHVPSTLYCTCGKHVRSTVAELRGEARCARRTARPPSPKTRRTRRQHEWSESPPQYRRRCCPAWSISGPWRP